MTRKAPLLPHFIIIGAMKCGTTALYRYLSEHPGVEMSREKETDFFLSERNWDLGLDWYSSQFTRSDAVRGEASPNYTKCRDFPGVADRMAMHVPEARLVYIVRDPVTRAESQFRHSFIMGTLDADPASFHGSHEYHHIMDASHYARQMDEYTRFYDRDAILVLDFDDLVAYPQAVMDRVAAHIGVKPHVYEAKGAQNDSGQLSRVPAPILRFAQTRIGRNLGGLISRDVRDKIRANLAFGVARQAPAFPNELRRKMREELSEDAARFRELTEMSFPSWSL